MCEDVGLLLGGEVAEAIDVVDDLRLAGVADCFTVRLLIRLDVRQRAAGLVLIRNAHFKLPEVHLRFVTGRRFLAEGCGTFRWLNVAGLLPQIFHVFEEGRFLAVEVRKLVLDPIHDIGCRRLWADFQDADNEGAVLFEIHCCLQCASDTDIVNNETAFLIFKNAVDAGDGLHEVVSMHRLLWFYCILGYFSPKSKKIA